jgi:hypothetical protein
MSNILQKSASARQCPYCGKSVAKHLVSCPHCREGVSQVQVKAAPPAAKKGQLGRGLLYMLLALVIRYAAEQASSMNLPFSIHPAVTSYLSPMLFLGGLGLALYGVLSRATS